MAYANGPRIVTDGLVLHLDAANRKSYPGSGNTWYDLSGQNNHFTLSGPDFLESNLSTAHFSLIDNQGDYVYRSTTDVIGGLSAITFSMWNRLDVAANQTFFLSYATNTNNNAYLLGQTSTTQLDLWLGSNYLRPSFNNSNYPVNEWFNLVFARNNASMTVYINGTQKYSTTSFFSGNIATGGFLIIGQEQDSRGGTFSNTQDYPGDIATIQIHNKQLSANEVQQNYNALKGRYGLS